MEFILLVFNLMTSNPDRFMFRTITIESCNKLALQIVVERYNEGKSVQYFCVPQKVENILKKTSFSV